MYIFGFLKNDFRVHSFQGGEIMGPKKIEAIVKMFIPTIPHDIQVLNDLTQFYCCFVKFLHSS
jgi:hypothetical protein